MNGLLDTLNELDGYSFTVVNCYYYCFLNTIVKCSFLRKNQLLNLIEWALFEAYFKRKKMGGGGFICEGSIWAKGSSSRLISSYVAPCLQTQTISSNTICIVSVPHFFHKFRSLARFWSLLLLKLKGHRQSPFRSLQLSYICT